MKTMLPGRWLAVPLLLAGCYESSFGAAEEDAVRDTGDADARVDRPDAGPDADDAARPGDDAEVRDDAWVADVLPDWRRDDAGYEVPDVTDTTHLEPESESESYYGSESGMAVQVHSGWLVPAAFSGSVYEIIMDEHLASTGEDLVATVYRLAPGGDRLGTTWIDEAINATNFGSICWTGEVFLVALPTTDVGIRMLAVDEAGVLVHGPTLLADHPDPSVGGVVYCPSSGPVILGSIGSGGTWRLHRFGRDGVADGTFVDLDLPFLGSNMWEHACAEAGDEIACITSGSDTGTDPARIVFIGRDGSLRYSPALPEPVPCGGSPTGCDLVFLGDGLGLVWAADAGGKPILTYARTDRDGNVVLGPVSTGRQVGEGPLGFHAATSGSTLFVVAEGINARRGLVSPEGHLLGLDGTLLGGAVEVSGACGFDFPPPTECTDGPGFWRGMAVFWEGDAYSAIWNTWPDQMVAYRRFLVVP